MGGKCSFLFDIQKNFALTLDFFLSMRLSTNNTVEIFDERTACSFAPLWANLGSVACLTIKMATKCIIVRVCKLQVSVINLDFPNLIRFENYCG